MPYLGCIANEENDMTKMDATEARETVAAMVRETPRNARIAVLRMAIARPGPRMTPEAIEVYRAALAAETTA